MSLIGGDNNAHHSRWDTSTNEDERGEQLADEINTVDCTIPSENEATRLPTNGRSTSADISLASNDIALLSHWSVSTSPSSDHLPIIFTINSELSTFDETRRTYINFKKAVWARYAEADETRTVEQAEKTFRKVVNMTSGLFIPGGRIRLFPATLPALAKSLTDEQDRRRRLNPADETLNDLNRQMQKLVMEDKRTKWQSAVDKCDHRTGLSHLWWLVKGLSGKKTEQLAHQGHPVSLIDLRRPHEYCQ